MAAPVRLNLAESYHEDSKYQAYTLPRLLAGVRSFEAWAQAQPFDRRASKAYPGAPIVLLPRPASLLTSLGHLLATRRSQRAAAPKPMSIKDLASLLWAAQGLRADGHRTAPSAGAMYPLEVYILADAVRGVPPGLHHYDPMRHCLEELRPRSANGGQWYLEEDSFTASAHIVITAVLPRLAIKYGERAYRFALQESGHAAQNLLLAAQARRLSAVPVGGFYDDRVHDDLELDGVEETVLYVVPVSATR